MDGDFGKFESLVKAGATPSDRTETERWNYLHSAFLNPRQNPPPEMVSRLIAWGVDVTAIDSYGSPPLHYAAQLGTPEAPEIIRLLVRAGASVNALNAKGISPLRAAALNYGLNIAAVRALLELGADMNQRSAKGRSVREMVELNPHGRPDLKTLIAEFAARARPN
jgi:ankyrin repeat protein